MCLHKSKYIDATHVKQRSINLALGKIFFNALAHLAILLNKGNMRCTARYRFNTHTARTCKQIEKSTAVQPRLQNIE
jgi:hypothetical protein